MTNQNTITAARKAMWRRAVEQGKTTVSMEDWLDDQDAMPAYICVVSEVKVYRFVDLANHEVVRVVVDDDDVTSPEDSAFRFATIDFDVIVPGVFWPQYGEVFGDTPCDEDIAEAVDIIELTIGPEWIVGWDS